MKAEIKDNAIHIVILDISGIYAQIHDQGYFDVKTVEDIQRQYSYTKHWRVLVLDNE